MKTAPWILSCILFVVILFIQMCPRKQPATVPKSEYDAMKKAVADTANYYELIIKADDAAIDLATGIAEEADQRARLWENKVDEGQKVIDRQAAKIDAAKKEQPNDSFIPVSPNYIDGCDSMRLVAGWQGTLINKLKQDNSLFRAAKDQEIATRDNKLIDLENFNIALRKQLDTCLAKGKDKDEVKVKNQWFGEIGLMGNQLTPIGGGEIGLTLINKRGVMYGVKGQILAGQAWVGVKTGFKLFK